MAPRTPVAYRRAARPRAGWVIRSREPLRVPVSPLLAPSASGRGSFLPRPDVSVARYAATWLGFWLRFRVARGPLSTARLVHMPHSSQNTPSRFDNPSKPPGKGETLPLAPRVLHNEPRSVAIQQTRLSILSRLTSAWNLFKSHAEPGLTPTS